MIDCFSIFFCNSPPPSLPPIIPTEKKMPPENSAATGESKSTTKAASARSVTSGMARTPEAHMYEWLLSLPRPGSSKAASATPQIDRTSEDAAAAEVAAVREGLPAMGAKDHRRLQDLVRPHVDSFDFFLGEGSRLLLENVDPVELATDAGERLRLAPVGLSIGMPCFGSPEEVMLPAHCRQGLLTYAAPGVLTVRVENVDTGATRTVAAQLGRVPIMVGSRHCWLARTPHERYPEIMEDTHECGGYFIVNGNERLIRMLIYPRPNHPIAVCRPSWQNKGPGYSRYGVTMRCMLRDSTTRSITLHYLTTGEVTLRFIFRRQEFFVPAVLLLKALAGLTDQNIYERLTSADPLNPALTTAAEMVLRAQVRGGSNGNASGDKKGEKKGDKAANNTSSPIIRNQEDALVYLGSRFRVGLMCFHVDRMSDKEVGEFFLRKFVLAHLESAADKCNTIILMMQKLFALAHGEIDAEDVDSPAFQSLLLPGHLYLAIVQDLIHTALSQVPAIVRKDLFLKKKVDFESDKYLHSRIESATIRIGQKLTSFLSTGTYNSMSGLDLMQVTGFVVMADRLNHNRFMSHFQSVHRGAFYTTMKTTAIRKLMPESWGFLCPVHTPDGAPCGLLNHVAVGCRAVCAPTESARVRALETLLAELGMAPVAVALPEGYVPAVLNGRVLGYVHADRAATVADTLRAHKVRQTRPLPEALEIAYVDGRYGTGFRALYLSCDMGRMIRPVLHSAAHAVEWIGPLEQLFLDIALPSEPDQVARASHRELTPNNMLSLLANMIPLSNLNQSPRNMYQCQMAKQTMGIPCNSYAYRADNKLLCLHYPQRPISRTRHQAPFLADEYPQGTNAVIAVISYTGYDMEDAFILNKASVERGFAHASMYKTYRVDLAASHDSAAEYLCGRIGGANSSAGANNNGGRTIFGLDADGLPQPGSEIVEGTPLYAVLNEVSGKVHKKSLHMTGEKAYVDSVRVLQSFSGPNLRDMHCTRDRPRKAAIKLRYPRNPVIGDKFSSRHGQKGVTSRLFPQEDMPFSESGITPDCIINPCAFPSRMTIGMLVETMAGKSGALQGLWQDCSSFKHDEKHPAGDYFGQQLLKSGYSYYGTERLYSGVTGREFEAEIYIGIVYYQRLVHQVKDKFQVRSIGPVNEITQQPLQGRKRGGGIRLGEMERDSLIAHGTSMLIQDRLFNCSDRSLHYVCPKCGSIYSPVARPDRRTALCRACGYGVDAQPVYLPYVLRYLAAELAAMNIRLTFHTH